jgi:hypothetical protein
MSNANEETGMDAKRMTKYIQKREKEKQSSSAASSGDDDNDDVDFTPSTSMNSNNTNSQNRMSTNFSRTPEGIPSKSHRSKKRNWEVIEGYRDANLKVNKPQNFEGILLKRRNWPMKGWHKRYFILADGILTYGKSKSDMTKGKTHGTINAFLSIVSYNYSSRRLLIDSSTQLTANVCHLKVISYYSFHLFRSSLN